MIVCIPRSGNQSWKSTRASELLIHRIVSLGNTKVGCEPYLRYSPSKKIQGHVRAYAAVDLYLQGCFREGRHVNLHNIRHGSWSTAPVIKAGVRKVSVPLTDIDRKTCIQSYVRQTRLMCVRLRMISFSGILVSSMPPRTYSTQKRTLRLQRRNKTTGNDDLQTRYISRVRRIR